MHRGLSVNLHISFPLQYIRMNVLLTLFGAFLVHLNSNLRWRSFWLSFRILVAIVLGFAILALPNQIFFAYLDIADNREPSSEASDVLQLLGILLLLHTSFNAAVYSIMDDHFREDARKLCCCFCSCKEGRESSSATVSSSNGGNSSQEAKRASTAVWRCSWAPIAISISNLLLESIALKIALYDFTYIGEYF